MPVPKLVTERLTLREIKNKDIFAHTELFSDTETMELFGGPVIENDLDLKNVIETKQKEFEDGAAVFWAITITDEREFIGFVRIMSYASYYFDASFSSMGDLRNQDEFQKYISRKGWEIDYALMKDYRSQGIMSEALKIVLNYCTENNYSPVYAKVNDISNTSTVSLLKKNYFKELLNQANHKGGMGMIYKFDKPNVA